MTPQPPVDPAIQAAHITRRGALVGAVVAALITASATGIGAYFAGRKEGVAVAHTETVRETVTVSGPAGQDTSPGSTTRAAPGGAMSLLELSPVEAAGKKIVTDPQRVDTKTYQRAITMWMGLCSGGDTASRTYHLDRKYQRLQGKIGLSDSSKSDRRVEFRVFVDSRQVDTATAQVGLGQVREIDVDVTNALRVRLEVYFQTYTCYSEYQAGAVWIEPTLG